MKGLTICFEPPPTFARDEVTERVGRIVYSILLTIVATLVPVNFQGGAAGIC